MSEKGLTSKTYSENPPTANSKEICDLIFKWSKEQNRYFSKEDLQITNRFMRRCSMSPTREMQIKTRWRQHLLPIRMNIIRKAKDSDVEKRTFVQWWQEYKLVQPLWKRTCMFLRIKNRTAIWSSKSTSGCISKANQITMSKRYLHFHATAWCMIARTQTCPQARPQAQRTHSIQSTVLHSPMKTVVLWSLTTWINPEVLMLSETSQPQRDKHHMFSQIWRI